MKKIFASPKQAIKMLKYIHRSPDGYRTIEDVTSRFHPELYNEYLYYDYIKTISGIRVKLTISGLDKLASHRRKTRDLIIGALTLIISLLSLLHQLFID